MKNVMRKARTYSYYWVAGLIIFLVSACSSGGTDTPPDTGSPTIPTNVQATTLSPNVIMLTWDASSDDAGVTQYEVYVGGVPIVSLPSTTTMFLYSDLAPGTEYCCTVRAIDAAGNESAVSDPACAVTGSATDTIPPAAPSVLTGTCSQSKVVLSWNAPADGVRFSVYRDGVLSGAVTTPNFIDSGLAASTPYCYAITAFDAAGNESAKSDPFCITTLAPPLDTTVPAVIATFPLNNATNVQTDPFMATATFSEPMNMISVIMSGNFMLSGAAGLVPGVVSYDITTDTAKFMPSLTLASGAVYTATVSSAVEDAAGNFMRVDYVWSFTTAVTPTVTFPTVIATNPANNESNVAVEAFITAQFWEPILGTTIMAPSNFTCVASQGGIVSGTVSYDDPTWTATLTPSTALAHATIYTCRISKNVTDQAGHGMLEDYVWSFMTMP